MDTTQVMDQLREAVGIAIKLAAPMLLLSMLVGVVVAIFQAVTQIHELRAEAHCGDRGAPAGGRLDAGYPSGLYVRDIPADCQLSGGSVPCCLTGRN